MEPVLVTENLCKKYGERTVLPNINMKIGRGDIYGFIGKNGAGKTTTLKIILGLAHANSGEVKLFGSKKITEVGLKVGSLIEAPGLYKNASAYENLKRFSILYGADESKINGILKLVGLEKTGNRKTKDFSLGMKQRLGIAIALLGEPELMLLDEPINGLDPEGIKEVRDTLLKLNRERGITILVSSHLLDELAKIVTRYGIINNGNLVEEVSAKELRARCRHRLNIETIEKEKTMKILSEFIPEKEISFTEKGVALNSHLDESAEINRKLVQSGVPVSAIYANTESLEDYFIEKIGA